MKRYKRDDETDLFELISESDIKELRKIYSDNCYTLACELYERIFNNGILCSTITFINGSSFRSGTKDLVVWNELNYEYVRYRFHSVLLLGEYIIDLLHSDKILDTSEYVCDLSRNNKYLSINQSMSGVWYDDLGAPFQVQLRYLREMG